MLIDGKVMEKLEHIENRYMKFRYEKVGSVPVQMCETYNHFTCEPMEGAEVTWKDAPVGTRWGDNWQSAWFKGDIELPEKCLGKKVFIRALTNGETLFIVNNEYKGVFDDNHPVVLMTQCGKDHMKYHLAFEAYAGHHKPGCGPDENDSAPIKDCKTFNGIEVVIEREDVSAFIFDLKVLRQLYKTLDENSLRCNRVIKGLAEVYRIIAAMPSEVPEEIWRPKLAQARKVMKPLLEAKNGSTVPEFGVVGHSHIDTAWLWPIAETWRKCARTFSSVLNLMEQYPEFKLIQSTPYYTSIVKERYPWIYENIEKRVKEGRWEPNGAMWVEPDCNIPSGESLVRQLLVGQNATREMFGYTSDTLWLPDVFGYSAALPQILQGANVKYFCTTKLSWNDTNRFPYDTFIWEGIDGSSVISHFNTLQCWVDPETLNSQWENVQHKDLQDRMLLPIGHGDGGGGPMAEMIEVSRLTKNLEGCPKTHFTTVSDFMNGIEKELTELPKWCGELYLELHRGTLTSIADIKRFNRKAEIAFRNAEFLSTLASINGEEYPKGKLLDMWKELLINQFHDILPGSSIARVNDEALEAFKKCMEAADTVIQAAITKLAKNEIKNDCAIMAINTLSWDRNGEYALDNLEYGLYPELDKVKAQWVKSIDGKEKLIVAGANIPALGWKVIPLTTKEVASKSPFIIIENEVVTPYAVIKFDSIGRINSFMDKASGRELVKCGGAFNTFWLGEDVPSYWDNWDIDRDQRLKMNVEQGFIERKIVADGPLQLRLRSSYKIGVCSALNQDIVFHADSPQVDFETEINWAEKHKLLKVGFDLNVFIDKAKHEIQYGHVERPTHENLSQDRARFESCAHKWSDFSEAEFGVSILNDCKFGISVHGSDARLSLMKSGLRPDARGDEGVHYVTYSLLPHNNSFGVETVVRPAYELNTPVVCSKVSKNTVDFKGLLEVRETNIIVEAIKWAENENGFVVRFYDAYGTGKKVHLKFNVPLKEVFETNLLEERLKECELEDNEVTTYVKPFEIKTIVCKI